MTQQDNSREKDLERLLKTASEMAAKDSDPDEPVVTTSKDGTTPLVVVAPKDLAQFGGYMSLIDRSNALLQKELTDLKLEIEKRAAELRQTYQQSMMELAAKADAFHDRMIQKYHPPFYPAKMDTAKGGFVYDANGVSVQEAYMKAQLERQGIRAEAPKAAEIPVKKVSAPEPTPAPATTPMTAEAASKA